MFLFVFKGPQWVNGVGLKLEPHTVYSDQYWRRDDEGVEVSVICGQPLINEGDNRFHKIAGPTISAHSQ